MSLCKHKEQQVVVDIDHVYWKKPSLVFLKCQKCNRVKRLSPVKAARFLRREKGRKR